MAASVIRFSSKYMAHSVRRQVIERFKHIIPQSFDEVGNAKSYTQIFGSDEPQPHLFQLLSLFRECKLMTFLPWTYYAICALGFEKLVQGDTTHDGKEIRLDTYDTRIALLGWKSLCQMTHNIRTHAITLPQCCTLSSSYLTSCSQTMRLAWTRKAASTFETQVMERWELFKALAYSGKPSHESLYDGYKFTLAHGRPCRDCATEWLRQEKKDRVNVWSQLPGVFELPDWETLKQEEELAVGSDSGTPSEDSEIPKRGPALFNIYANYDVIVHGLVFKDGISIPQTFQKGVSRSGRIRDFRDDYFIRPGGFPSRPSSSLPPPGSENLSISLGEMLSTGRVGIVHQTTLLTRDNLPPLIVKISRHKRSASIEQEAWFYEELEQVQGVAVPRCYGLFQTHIEDGTEVLVWRKKRHSESNEAEEFEEAEGSNESEKSSESSDYGNPRMHWDTEDSDGEIIPVFPPPDPTLITILLLERLGERMPLRESLETIKLIPHLSLVSILDDSNLFCFVRSDVFEIYNDISRLGIEHLDIRWSNILSVQDPDHQPEENVCLNHGHAHRWRIVDFDLARKSNGRIDFLDGSAKGWLSRLFLNLRMGNVIEPWE